VPIGIFSNTTCSVGGLHYAILNAGVEGARAPTHTYPTAAFDRLMAVNLRGTWLCLKHLAPLLLDTGPDGAVVVTSSTAGGRGRAGARGPDAIMG
jgi:NAD(P)-dependent dehydrogenase (short-subunit alcohol dehydrogenase family)